MICVGCYRSEIKSARMIQELNFKRWTDCSYDSLPIYYSSRNVGHYDPRIVDSLNNKCIHASALITKTNEDKNCSIIIQFDVFFLRNQCQIRRWKNSAGEWKVLDFSIDIWHFQWDRTIFNRKRNIELDLQLT